jgi:hypothetical protein
MAYLSCTQGNGYPLFLIFNLAPSFMYFIIYSKSITLITIYNAICPYLTKMSFFFLPHVHFQAPLKPKDRRRRGQEGVRFGPADDWHPWFLGLRIHKLLTLCS